MISMKVIDAKRDENMLHQYATLLVDISRINDNRNKRFHKVVKNNLLEQVQIRHEKIESTHFFYQ